jgi:hypothetical protein
MAKPGRDFFMHYFAQSVDCKAIICEYRSTLNF